MHEQRSVVRRPRLRHAVVPLTASFGWAVLCNLTVELLQSSGGLTFALKPVLFLLGSLVIWCGMVAVWALTGRLRAGVTYTDSKNTPFQSLCADGGKLALWRLLYAGFDVYAFIHDETLVQLPADGAGEEAGKVKEIKVKAMEEVRGHGIPADCDWVVADWWTKP